jgi:ATP-binding cassette subfamily E protein 1
MHKYMVRLYSGLKVAIKPQHVDQLIRYLSIKKEDPDVQSYLVQHSDHDPSSDLYKYIVESLELNKIINCKVKELSGGELQRLVCCSILLKDADVYIFDEPTNFLDIKQRLKVAHLIRSLLKPNRYIVVIEHDLAILDYMSDYICLMYGKPGAYGVVSVPSSTANAINMFFDGYIPAENMRFRKVTYSIDLNDTEVDVELKTGSREYLGTVVNFPNFKLTIKDGSFPLDSSICVILGENGTGKTTFIKYLAKQLSSQTNGATISCKPQYLNIGELVKGGRYPTVEEFYYDKIRNSYINELFKSDVIRPMHIDSIKNRRINELSGGELQRFWIVYCLGTNADIYLIDEPSACLDIEQRVKVTKIIKRFILHNKKIGFIVEHDIMMSVSMAQEVNSQIIVMEGDLTNTNGDIRSFVACKPMPFREGINKFLKSLDITFRTDTKYSKHNRPRINKYNSVKDREQKAMGEYYQ